MKNTHPLEQACSIDEGLALLALADLLQNTQSCVDGELANPDDLAAQGR